MDCFCLFRSRPVDEDNKSSELGGWAVWSYVYKCPHSLLMARPQLHPLSTQLSFSAMLTLLKFSYNAVSLLTPPSSVA